MYPWYPGGIEDVYHYEWKKHQSKPPAADKIIWKKMGMERKENIYCAPSGQIIDSEWQIAQGEVEKNPVTDAEEKNQIDKANHNNKAKKCPLKQHSSWSVLRQMFQWMNASTKGQWTGSLQSYIDGNRFFKR